MESLAAEFKDQSKTPTWFGHVVDYALHVYMPWIGPSYQCWYRNGVYLECDIPLIVHAKEQSCERAD